MTEAHRRRWLVQMLIVVVVAVGVVVGGPWVYARFVASDAPAPLAITPTAQATPEIPVGPVDIEGDWFAQPGSQAGYRINETMSGQPVEVVGRTDGVTGTLTIEGGTLTAATVVVDVASISTGEAARDLFFQRALDATTNPTATFTLTQPVDVAALGQTDAPASITAVGTLTMHGVERPVSATLQVQRAIGGAELAAQLPVTLADFNLVAPDLGWVVVQPTGSVEVHLVLGRQEPPSAG